MSVFRTSMEEVKVRPTELQRGVASEELEKMKTLKRVRRSFSTGFGLFYDPKTGETLGKDATIALETMINAIIVSPTHKFEKEIKARAAQLDAEAIGIDSCYEEDLVKRAKMLRISSDLYRLAEEHELAAPTSSGIRARMLRLTSKFKAAIDSELELVDGEMFEEVINSSRKGMTVEEKIALEEARRNIDSPKTRDYLERKLWEKRIKMVTYVMGGIGVGVVAGGLWWAGSAISAPFSNGVGDAIKGVAGVAAVGVLHLGNRARIEWMKIKTVVAEMEHRFREKRREKAKEAAPVRVSRDDAEIMREAAFDMQRGI